MKIKIRDFANIGLYIACFIAFTFYGVDYFIPGLASNMAVVYLLCGIAIAIFSILSITHNGGMHLKGFDIWTILILFFPLLWNNRELEIGAFTRASQYVWVLVLYIAFRSSKKEDWVEKFFRIIMFVGVFYAFFTVLSFISSDFFYSAIYPTLSSTSPVVARRLNNWYSLGYMTGITAHYSTNGIYIGLGVIPWFVISILERRYTEKGRALTVITFLLILLALALTGKRAHLVFTLAALLIVMYFYYADQKYSRVIKILFYLGVAALVVYIVSLFIPQIMNAYNRIIEGIAENNLDNGRDELSAYAIVGFLSAPYFGHGWSWYSQNNIVSLGDHAHNTYYQLLCETGIAGFTLYVLFFGVTLIRTITLLVQICKNKKTYLPRDRAIVSSAVAYELFFLMYMVTGNPLYEFSCYLPLFLFIAAVESIRDRVQCTTIRNEVGGES